MNHCITDGRLKGRGILLLAALSLVLFSCGKEQSDHGTVSFSSWDEVTASGRGEEVFIYMWGGNDQVNRFMDGYVAEKVKEKYGITLNRVPSVPPEYLKKLINEKKEQVHEGTADIVWINAENFRTARDAELLWGPFTGLLPNLGTYYDPEADDLKFDAGVPIEGFEAIWGRAQLVLTYDSAIIKEPPRTFAELLKWAAENPGTFTYPVLPDDFAGSAFVRTACFELTGEKELFYGDISREDFERLSRPVMEYFNKLKPFLWQKGEVYPRSQARQDELFKNGEVLMTMGFEAGKSSGQIAMGMYPETVRTFVFDSGTVGNSHYLAVPFNSPRKAAALLVIDFLQSPEAQIEKYKPEVWGDMPAFDTGRIDPVHRELLERVHPGPATLEMSELAERRIADMPQKYIGWIEEIWVRDVAKK